MCNKKNRQESVSNAEQEASRDSKVAFQGAKRLQEIDNWTPPTRMSSGHMQVSMSTARAKPRRHSPVDLFRSITPVVSYRGVRQIIISWKEKKKEKSMYSNEWLALWDIHRGTTDALGSFILVTQVATDLEEC